MPFSVGFVCVCGGVGVVVVFDVVCDGVVVSLKRHLKVKSVAHPHKCFDTATALVPPSDHAS